MSATVTRLPTAATSFYTVRKSGKFWAIVLETPSWPKPIRTTLERYADREIAVERGKATAAALHKPFRAAS